MSEKIVDLNMGVVKGQIKELVRGREKRILNEAYSSGISSLFVFFGKTYITLNGFRPTQAPLYACRSCCPHKFPR